MLLCKYPNLILALGPCTVLHTWNILPSISSSLLMKGLLKYCMSERHLPSAVPGEVNTVISLVLLHGFQPVGWGRPSDTV